MTAFCGALVSFYHKTPVYHVEAGLRSYDIYEPFPEEVMRQMTSRVAELHFAPTEVNKKALLKEDIAESKIHVVGNTVIDALFCLSDEVIETLQSAQWWNWEKERIEKNLDAIIHGRVDDMN